MSTRDGSGQKLLEVSCDECNWCAVVVPGEVVQDHDCDGEKDRW